MGFFHLNRGGIAMRKLFVVAAITVVAGVCWGEMPGNFVLVKGGTFKNTTSNFYGNGVTISDFYIDKYDVTQKEWVQVMGTNPSHFIGDDLPVETVTWYDSIEYCNKRSIQEGLHPYYNIDKSRKDPHNLPDPKFGDLDDIKWTVTINAGANGYRLPTEAEWEYAAGGGQLSQSYIYSGSNYAEDVAWIWNNSGDSHLTGYWVWQTIEENHDRTHSVGAKKPNELGLYDMSGNVREWCWDWSGDLKSNVTDPQGSQDGYRRVWKGGGWMGADFAAATAFRGSLAANGKGPDQGFRVCRNK
jgi:formylglycine-generating enzyme